MKTNTCILAVTLISFPFAQVPSVLGQPVTEVTETTTTTGTVSEFGPDRIIVRTETSRKPLRYTFTKTTTYVDENGVPVSIETVKSGLPVTVYYSKDGERMIATKVVVRRPPPVGAGPAVREEKVTRTTTMGTVDEFGPDAFVIRSETSPEPMRYVYTKKTTYVDENGVPVSVETVKSGLPVTVYYTRDGDRMIANKVVVRKALPPGTIIKKKTTTVEEK